MNDVKKITFTEHGDNRGHLVVVEGGIDVPFEIKRLFYIYDSNQDVVRGQHANRKSEFVLVNISGTCKVKVSDGKGQENIFLLDKPCEGLYIPAMWWKDMYDITSNFLLLALSSEHYDSNEYIRNYDTFVNEVNNNV
jgi:dTDP-4-dehydrorhamnose 3,5-epimerase-like enzyme